MVAPERAKMHNTLVPCRSLLFSERSGCAAEDTAPREDFVGSCPKARTSHVESLADICQT